MFAVVILELGSRRSVHMALTAHPTDAWVAQQFREATLFQRGTRSLIRDNDKKYGQQSAMVAQSPNIEGLRTPIRAPKANAICERFIGSVRRECLEHLLIGRERHLFRVMKVYVDYDNAYRPHQRLAHRIPLQDPAIPAPAKRGLAAVQPILDGLHQHYSQVAA
jgi:transposase InsO family protein